jgi:hypothetical protein
MAHLAVDRVVSREKSLVASSSRKWQRRLHFNRFCFWYHDDMWALDLWTHMSMENTLVAGFAFA